jgi:uncharacterized coiled-coil DUF342 family protein
MSRMSRAAVVALAAIALSEPVLAGQVQRTAPRALGLDPAAVKAINEMGPDLEKLGESHRNLMRAVGELDGLYAKLAQKVEEVSRLAGKAQKSKAGPAAELFKAAREMQKMQMSFNLQYLQLQSQISHENRQFSMVSNIMKNKHDTAKNAVNNIR